MDIKYLIKAGKVRRFHTEQMLTVQTVADHSWGVAVLARRFYPDYHKLVGAALFHDAEEKDVGDMPAPAKWINPNVVKELRVAEAQIRRLHNIPVVDLEDHEKNALKVCDYLELMCHCLMEIRMGNEFATGPFFRVIPVIINHYRNSWSTYSTISDYGVVQFMEDMLDAAFNTDCVSRRTDLAEKRHKLRRLLEEARRRRCFHDDGPQVGPSGDASD